MKKIVSVSTAMLYKVSTTNQKRWLPAVAPRILTVLGMTFLLAQTWVVSAQQQGDSLAPYKFMSKSSEQCDKIMGKPGLVNADGLNSETRFYKTKIKDLVRITLGLRILPPETAKSVYYVKYDFSKTGIKNWKEAVRAIGINPDTVKEERKTVKFGGKMIESCNVTLSNGLRGQWYDKEWTKDGNRKVNDKLHFLSFEIAM